MDTTLKCPKCGAPIPLTDAFRKEIEADLLAVEHQRHAEELANATAAASKAATRKAQLEHAAREAALTAESLEEKARNTRLLKQLEEINRRAGAHCGAKTRSASSRTNGS